MKALVGTFNQEKALVEAFSVRIVKSPLRVSWELYWATLGMSPCVGCSCPAPGGDYQSCLGPPPCSSSGQGSTHTTTSRHAHQPAATPPLGTRRRDEAGRIARDHQPAVRGLELGHECGAGLLSASPDLRGEGEDIL